MAFSIQSSNLSMSIFVQMKPLISGKSVYNVSIKYNMRLEYKDWSVTSDLRGCLYWWADWGHICSCTAAWLQVSDAPYTRWTAGQCGPDTALNASPDPGHTSQNTETQKHIKWMEKKYMFFKM